MTIRIMESMAAIRLIKLTRYYEGAQLIALAIMKSLSQLLVPLFMLFAMVFLFSMIIYDIEWDSNIERCRQLWSAQGITNTFLSLTATAYRGAASLVDLRLRRSMETRPLSSIAKRAMVTHPARPSVSGVVFTQTTDMPAAMWFTVVTVTTVGYGDVSPTTWRGQLFSVIVILTGVIFLAMPLAIVETTYVHI